MTCKVCSLTTLQRQDDYLDGIVEEEEEEVEGSRTPSPLAGKEKNKPILPTSLELDPMDLPPIIQDVPMLDLGNDETDPTGVEPIEISEDEPAAGAFRCPNADAQS